MARVAGWSAPRTLLEGGQESSELVAGRGGISRLAHIARQVGAGAQGPWIVGAQDLLDDGQEVGEWLVAGSGGIACLRRSSGPRLARVVRVPGWSAPMTCSTIARERFLFAGLRLGPTTRQVLRGQVDAGGEGVGVVGAQDACSQDGQQAVYWSRPGRIPCLPGPPGQVAAGGEGVGVVGAQNSLAGRRQAGLLVAAACGLPPRHHLGQVAAGGEGVGVVGAQDSLESASRRNWSGHGRVARLPVQRARLPRAVRVSGWSGPRTRSQRR